MRERVNAELARRGEAKLSYLPFIAKALLQGLPGTRAERGDGRGEAGAPGEEGRERRFGAATEQG